MKILAYVFFVELEEKGADKNVPPLQINPRKEIGHVCSASDFFFFFTKIFSSSSKVLDDL